MATNIITAAFSSSTITYTKPAYQYDYGMILKFSGIDLPQAYEVHFSNTEFCGNSITQIGDADGVTIPDEMFLSGAPIYAWTYLHTGEDDGETVYKTVISINKRAQPSDIEPTPVQQDVITQAIAALNVAVEQTAHDVISAGESAQAASDAADVAVEARDQAIDAKEAAEDAQEGAETAQGKAEDAQRAAEQAAGSVLGLTADATVDANVGTPSVEVDVTTESDHKNMSFAFHNLKGVQGDPGDTGVGISSVVLNADYTLTITLTNGTSYTTSSIRGEVGATPNLTIGTVTTLPEGSQATATITGTDEDPVLNLGIPVGDTGDPGISPTITVTEITGGHEVEVVDAEGTQTFDVMDGLDGQSGLITDYIAEEKTPYLFRPSANGLANVISEKDTLIGGTAAWNQVIDLPTYSNTVTDTRTFVQFRFRSGAFPYAIFVSENIDNTGILQTIFKPAGDSNPSVGFSLLHNGTSRNIILYSDVNYQILHNHAYLFSINFTGNDPTTVGGVTAKNAMLIDLTQAFGTTIADYLYTLESGTSGSGIAKLKEWGFFTKDYYPYNSGDLLSVQTSAHVMRGFNQWDEEWEVGNLNTNGTNGGSTDRIRSKNYIKALPSMTYCAEISTSSFIRLVYYDSNKTFISYHDGSTKPVVVTTPANCAYIRFNLSPDYGTTYKNDICINLSGSKNGQYEPYSVHSYPLDSDLVLHGVLELDAQNNLYYHGDVYRCEGSVDRRYGIVDLGTLTWKTRTIRQNTGFWVERGIPGVDVTGSAGKANAICAKYPIVTNGGVGLSTNDKVMAIGAYYSSGCNIYLVDSAYSGYTDNQVKSALSGVYLVYELATPTTETADPYSEYQIVDADGTEEYVDERTVPIPVGHDTFYQQAVDVPQLPTTDGSYRLALSLRGNTATASWEYVAQAEMKAQTNIPSGKYFSVGERLFISTQAIAQGEQIVVGTNCSEVSLADALNQINA